MPFAALLLAIATLTPDPGGHSFQIPSQILGETRRVLVHLPASHAKTKRKYPVMIVFDGQYLLTPVVTASDALTNGGQIPESIIIAIENTNRLRDLTPPGISVSGSSLTEGGDRFLDFIEKELLPALDAQFRTGTPRILIGHSSGAILATYAAATRDTFPVVIALDLPAHLGDDWMEKQLHARAIAKSSPLRYASCEARFGWGDAAWARVVAVAPPSWKLYREHFIHESHNTMQLLGTYLGLRELFSDYSMFAAPVSPTTSILPSYEKLGLTPAPQPLIQQVVEDLLIEGRGAEAHNAFDSLVANYGEPADAAKWRAQIADVEKRPPPKETVEELLATPFPTPAEARDYIGSWDGEMWMTPVSKSRFLIEIKSDGSKVSGTQTDFPEPDTKLVQALQYLRITPEGMTFGVMNGMRPRGVLLYEGRREGNDITGVMRFGGVAPVPPPGMERPVVYFALHKRN